MRNLRILGGRLLLAILATLVGATDVLAQDGTASEARALLGLSVGGTSIARLGPAPCVSSYRDPDRRVIAGADARAVLETGRVRTEVRGAVHRMRADRGFSPICPDPDIGPDGTREVEVHPQGGGHTVSSTDVRLGFLVVEGLGLVASAGVGRMWSHHRTYLASGVGVRRGEGVRLAADLEGITFRHVHSVITLQENSGGTEEVDRREVREWRTGIGARVGIEIPLF